MLEITITHNLSDQGEVATLFKRRWIAIDFGRHGCNPDRYAKTYARSAVELFHRIRNEGAAVVAKYGNVTGRKTDRLVGCVRQGTRFTKLNGLLCLPLIRGKVYDSSRGFLGNLPPRQCTIQQCHKRAKGQLARLATGESIRWVLASIHHNDVEQLVSQYILGSGRAVAVWHGARAQEDVDHIFRLPSGKEAYAQTTISKARIAAKIEALRTHERANRELWLFAPKSSVAQEAFACIKIFDLEKIFADLKKCPEGRWLIARML